MKIGTDQYNTFDTMTMDCWNDRVYYEGKEFPAGHFAAEILNFAEAIHDPLLERVTVLTALVDDLSTAEKSERHDIAAQLKPLLHDTVSWLYTCPPFCYCESQGAYEDLEYALSEERLDRDYEEEEAHLPYLALSFCEPILRILVAIYNFCLLIRAFEMKYLCRLKRRNADAFAKAAHECFDEDDSFLILLEQMPFGGVEEFFSYPRVMLQKELAKRLKAQYDTKMDGNGWLEVSSNGIPLCRIKYNGQFLSNADQNLSDEYRSKVADIQDAISTVREYVGLYEHAPQMKAADVSDYRQLAAFGDTVLAATYSEKNGFMFCTWKQNADGDSVFWGDYSPNYEYVKEAFAVRSGLVNKHRLFSENESADIYRCVDFTKANCETLTYEQERQLDRLQEKLTDGYPSLEIEPPTFEQTAAPQQNM